MSTPTTVVLLDHTDDGQIRPSVFEVLTTAQAVSTTADIVAVWLGPGTVSDSDSEQLARHGVSVLHYLDTDASVQITAVAAELITYAVRHHQAHLVLAVSTFANKEITSHVAVELQAGLIVDASALEVQGEDIVAHKTVFAGTWNTQSIVTTPVKVMTVKPHSVTATVVQDRKEFTVEHSQVRVSEAAHRARLRSRNTTPTDGRPTLTDAQIVVCGGRGVDGDFSQVEALADALGGAVGATRVATDEGWIGHEAQIGQTGVTVAPKLYIGAGVSGAVHHRGGMQASGTIVAINTDANAPIFEIADFGIVGDINELLPRITTLIRQRTSVFS